MGAKKKLLQVREAFQLAQKPHQNHAKLVVALKSTYAQVRLPSGGPARGELKAPATAPLVPRGAGAASAVFP